MEHTHTAVAEGHHEGGSKSTIIRTLIILSVITLVEIGLAFLHLFAGFPPKLLLNSIFIGLTLVKAFYIVAEFMHLRHEIRNLIMTILIPLLLFVWFIIAFLADGNSWKNMRAEHPAAKVELPAASKGPGHD